IDASGAWLAFEPAGKTLLTATHHPRGSVPVVTRWDLANFKSQPLPLQNRGKGHTVYHLSSDGKTLFSLINDDAGMERRVRVNDLLALKAGQNRVCAVTQSRGGLITPFLFGRAPQKL